MTVEQRLARGADIKNYKATHISAEKRTRIEDMLKRGVGIVRTAQETGSSANTVTAIRDQLIERQPELFKAHLAGNLQRIANKTAAKIEDGLDQLHEVKAGQLPGLSVSLGIIVDKLAQLQGETSVQVVEHRLKIDADTVSSLIKARQDASSDDPGHVDVINVTPDESGTYAKDGDK